MRAPPPPAYDHEANATEWGYTRDAYKTVYNAYFAKDGHKPQSAAYLHHGGEWAISPDVSTHGGSNPGQIPYWKVFKDEGGWHYWGSYNGQLVQIDRGQGVFADAGDIPPTV